MKKIMIFIGLKVVEIAAVGFGPYYLGMLLMNWPWYCRIMELDTCPYWVSGIMFISLAVLALILIGLTCLLLIKNWEWTKKINDWLR